MCDGIAYIVESHGEGTMSCLRVLETSKTVDDVRDGMNISVINLEQVSMSEMRAPTGNVSTRGVVTYIQ